MDRYEYKLKFDEMKSLVAEGKYDSAIQIADTVNWKKVSNMGALMMAAEIYEQADRFEESIDLLLLAYDKSPIGKRVVYKLAEIAVKTGNIESAMDYYREFVEIAPHDTDKYILALEISKARGESVNSQIRILEELKEQEYTEEWAYELAYLYHKAGEVTKCVKACDELILWFGDGEYVEKALELKLVYQPLKPEQEAKYKALKEKKDGIKELTAPEQIDVSKFDTINLQDEIAKGMRGIIDAKEKDQVDESISTIKKLVDDIPYLSRAAREYKLPRRENVYIESDEEIDRRMKVNFEEILKEESDGQISLPVPERTGAVEQITGQLNIEDILSEWEKTKAAAEKTIAIAETEKLSAAKQRAMYEAGGIVDALSNIIPDAINVDRLIDQVSEQPDENGVPLGDTQELVDLRDMFAEKEDDSYSELPLNLNEEPDADDALERELSQEIKEQIDTDRQIPVTESAGTEGIAAEGAYEDVMEDHFKVWEQIKRDMQPEESDIVPESAMIGVEPAEDIDDKQTEMSSEPSDETMPKADSEMNVEPADVVALAGAAETVLSGVSQSVAETAETDQTDTKVSDINGEPETAQDGEVTQEPSLEPQKDIDIQPVVSETIQLPKLDLSPEIFERTEPKKRKKGKRTTVAQTTASLMSGHITELDDDLRGIFTYFLNVEGIEQQIIQVLDGTGKALLYRESAATGNIVITGISGSGKTTLGTDLAKALHAIIKRPGKKVGKISASALGHKNIADIVGKISPGCLIIEKSDGMTMETAKKLAEFIPTVKDETLFILEGTSLAVKRVFSMAPELEEIFSQKIIIPNFSTDELVAFARTYAAENGYSIEEMAVLALYRKLGNIERVGKVTCLLQVKDIMDEAFARVEKRGFKKALGIITSRRYDSENYVIIREKDLG